MKITKIDITTNFQLDSYDIGYPKELWKEDGTIISITIEDNDKKQYKLTARLVNTKIVEINQKNREEEFPVYSSGCSLCGRLDCRGGCFR
jgi:hypothetical protein